MSGSNADQITFWNGDAGARWVAAQERTDRLFVPLTAAALDHAAPRAGERVVDVGCGCGATVLELAARVGPSGSVLGVDVSQPMLDRAAARVAASGLAHVKLTLADASTHRFVPGSADLLFSRFGVMFFDDPEAAFTNLRSALAPGGRLTFVCWKAAAENPFFSVPLGAARPHLPPQPPPDANAPGPFAFADPARVRGILAAAGFAGVQIDPHETDFPLGADVDHAANQAVELGPLARVLAGVDSGVIERVRDSVRDALSAYLTGDGVILPGRLWLVSASA